MHVTQELAGKFKAAEKSADLMMNRLVPPNAPHSNMAFKITKWRWPEDKG